MRQALTMAEAANLYGQGDPRAARPAAVRRPRRTRTRVCVDCLKRDCSHLRPQALGPQEIRLLLLLPTGEPIKILAPQLGITAGTAKMYLGRAYRAIGVSGNVQAAIWAHDHEQELRAALGE